MVALRPEQMLEPIPSCPQQGAWGGGPGDASPQAGLRLNAFPGTSQACLVYPLHPPILGIYVNIYFCVNTMK